MADTDDDQTVALEPDQYLQGDDDPESASERRAARTRQQPDERPAAAVGLSAEEEAARREEVDELARKKADEELAEAEEEGEQARAETLELAAKEEQEREDLRQRGEILDATAETTRAMQLAYADEADRYRRLTERETLQAVSDGAHGQHLQDEAAAHPDEAGAAGLAAAGRRYERASALEDRKAEGHHRIADEYDAASRERRSEERPDQPDANLAVRNPPKETPEAQTPHTRNVVRGRLKNKKNAPDRSTEPDIGLSR